MKILAKIARRNNGNELPERRELVEMDLFDTDRNPWPLGASEFPAAVTFDAGTPDNIAPDTYGTAIFRPTWDGPTDSQVANMGEGPTEVALAGPGDYLVTVSLPMYMYTFNPNASVARLGVRGIIDVDDGGAGAAIRLANASHEMVYEPSEEWSSRPFGFVLSCVVPAINPGWRIKPSIQAGVWPWNSVGGSLFGWDSSPPYSMPKLSVVRLNDHGFGWGGTGG